MQTDKFHLCTPLMCTGKWGVSECYTGCDIGLIFLILGHVLNTFYLPVLVPLGVTGNVLSFLVRI